MAARGTPWLLVPFLLLLLPCSCLPPASSAPAPAPAPSQGGDTPASPPAEQPSTSVPALLALPIAALPPGTLLRTPSPAPAPAPPGTSTGTPPGLAPTPAPAPAPQDFSDLTACMDECSDFPLDATNGSCVVQCPFDGCCLYAWSVKLPGSSSGSDTNGSVGSVGRTVAGQCTDANCTASGLLGSQFIQLAACQACPGFPANASSGFCQAGQCSGGERRLTYTVVVGLTSRVVSGSCSVQDCGGAPPGGSGAPPPPKDGTRGRSVGTWALGASLLLALAGTMCFSRQL